mmetsp:Transcript_31880/g.63128  ORF Transcript_31880/g.63128 Transcript_31880/m.63128 type:complete len:109 (-) Transcript_31880:1344-1670(-)
MHACRGPMIQRRRQAGRYSNLQSPTTATTVTRHGPYGDNLGPTGAPACMHACRNKLHWEICGSQQKNGRQRLRQQGPRHAPLKFPPSFLEIQSLSLLVLTGPSLRPQS